MSDAARVWVARLAPYKNPDDRKAIVEIVITVVPFVALWALAYWMLSVSLVLALLITVPTAFLMVRLFIIQHDCGHSAMFSSSRANDWVGRLLGVLTLTPYDYWRHSHALHHAGSGNLDRRGIGDIDTLTVAEFQAMDWSGRLRYRLYRHPLVMFGLGPAYLFVLRHRVPIGAMERGSVHWKSAMGTNLGILMLYAALIYLVGIKAFLLIQVPVILIGASVGVWLFYVQHQFDETHWERNPDWKREVAALHGSSYYDLPEPLMWLTGYIGIHHVHHLSSRIPFHRLPKIVREYPELKEIGHLTLWESLKCVRLTLWDENAKRLISFRDFSKRQALAA